MKRLKNTSIFAKTVILNLILLFAVIIFTIVNHVYVSKIIRQSQNDANETFLSIVSNQMDDYLGNIINYSNEIAGDSNYTQLRAMSPNDEGYVEHIRLISDEFYKAKYALSLNPEFYIYLKDTERLVTYKGTNTLPALMKDKYPGSEPDTSTLLEGDIGISNGNIYFICANNPTFVFFYVLKAESLKDYMNDMSRLMGENVYADIILPDGSNIFYDETMPIYGEERDTFIRQSRTGRLYGLEYNVYSSEKDGMHQNNVFIVYTLLIALIFIALNCITIYMSYKIHRPLKQIVQGYGNKDKKYNNEYNVITEIIDDLSDKNKRIEDQLQNTAKSLYGLCLYKIFHGRHDYDAELLERLEEKVNNYFVVTCFFEYDAKEQYMDHSAELNSLFVQALPENGEMYNVIETRSQYSYVFCNVDYSVDIIEKISAAFYMEYGNSAFLSLGVSKRFEKVIDAQEAYMQSCVALQNQKINDSYSMFYNVYSDSTEMNEDITPFISREVEQNIISQLLSGSEKIAGDFLRQISIQLHKDIHYVEIKQMFISVDNLLKVVYKSSNLVYRNLFGKEEPDMSELSNPKLMFSLIKERMDEFLAYREKTQKDLFDNIVFYIRNNIAGDLYRENIAKEFGITPEYLSSYFKKVSGENMVDFIHKEKINKAKELLAGNRRLKVYEVSEMVGISNVKTFIRIFKQYTGITPKQFQTEHAED